MTLGYIMAPVVAVLHQAADVRSNVRQRGLRTMIITPLQGKPASGAFISYWLIGFIVLFANACYRYFISGGTYDHPTNPSIQTHGAIPAAAIALVQES